MNMGFVATFAAMNVCGKKQCRNLFWRVRAAVKKAMKNRGGKKTHLKLNYDASSYALNFDDGCCHLWEKIDAADQIQNKFLETKETTATVTTTLVYVFLVKAK